MTSRQLKEQIPGAAEADDFARIFAGAGTAIGKLAPDGRFLLVNQPFCELTGYDRDSLTAGAFQQITHPDDLEADLEAVQALLAGEAERYSRDKRYVRRNGRVIWVRVTVSLVRDADGEPDFFIKVVQNIDAYKIAEQVLAAREAQLRTIVETVPVGLLIAELPSGRVVGGNSYLEQLLRHPVLHSREIAEYDRWVSYHADGRQVAATEYPLARMALEREENPSLEANYRRGDGTFAWIRMEGRPVRDSTGEICGGVVAVVDIDEERKARDRAAEQLESLRNQLIHTSRVSAMGTMASTIAHEINQPLVAVASCLRGTINRLRKGGAPAIDEALRWLERGEQITLQTGETIQRLRTMLAHGEAKRETVPLARLIEDANAIALVGPAAKAISYRQDVDPSIKVDADAVQIQQVLINLVRNAVEAMAESPDRRLSVTATRDAHSVEICVRDSGPGIAEEMRASLFEPFQSSKPGGMGVGLSICRTIVEAHQGRIWVADGEEAGGAFCFTLPVAA
ncbi:MAG TPA: PAS domain S-box protein [Allosphingosinicella sp.]|nr:PAS domain S-box protein [Allosphingosinicella sp.]